MSVFQVKEPDAGKSASKRRRRREKVQHDRGASKLQVKILGELHLNPMIVDLLRPLCGAPPSSLHSTIRVPSSNFTIKPKNFKLFSLSVPLTSELLIFLAENDCHHQVASSVCIPGCGFGCGDILWL